MEIPKKKITLSGLRNSFKLYSYTRPFLVIDIGKVVEQGTHEKLVNISDGKYRDLSKLQLITQ